MANFFDTTYYSLCGFTLAPNRLSKWKSWIYMCPLPICQLSDQFQVLPKCFTCTKSNEMCEYHYHERPNYVLIIKEFYLFQLLNLWHALLTLGSNTFINFYIIMSAFSLPPPPRPSFTLIPKCFVVHYYHISAYNYHCIFLPIYLHMKPTYYRIG